MDSTYSSLNNKELKVVPFLSLLELASLNNKELKVFPVEPGDIDFLAL